MYIIVLISEDDGHLEGDPASAWARAAAPAFCCDFSTMLSASRDQMPKC